MFFKDNLAKKMVALFLVIVGIVVGAFVVVGVVQSRAPEFVVEPNNSYDQTLRVAMDQGFEPYSFYNEKGEAAGYDVELIYAIADSMHRNVEIRMMDWNEAVKALQSGEVDLLMGQEYVPRRFPDKELSLPLHIDPFVAFGKEPFRTIGDLYGKRLAAMENSGSYSLFLTPFQLEANTTAYPTYGKAFESVMRGENDYVIMRYSVGRRAVARLEASDIKAMGPVLANSDFCIAADLGNTALIEQVNQAIIQERADGTVDALTSKWLGRYVEVISLRDFFEQNRSVFWLLLILLLLVLMLCFVLFYRKRLYQAERSKQKLLERAARDQMTKLFNRSAFEGLVTQIMADAGEGETYAFFMLDIDNFKNVNDSYGHNFGDVAITEFADAIKGTFRDSDIVARVGGDEFAVFMKHVTGEQMIEQKAQKLVSTLKREINAYGKSMRISGSVGIAMAPKDGIDFHELFQKADYALYEVKKTGKGRYAMFRGYEVGFTEEDAEHPNNLQLRE